MTGTYWVIRRRDPITQTPNDVVTISTRAVRPVRQVFGGLVTDPPAIGELPLGFIGTGLRSLHDLDRHRRPIDRNPLTNR